MDSLIRNHVKDILHLPVSTPNGLLCCSKRDGGLGTPKLETYSVSTVLKQGITLLNTTDPTIQVIFTYTRLDHKLERMAKSVRLQWPISNFKYIDAYKKRQKRKNSEWNRLRSKGKSVLSFADDRYGNAWLYDPSLLKPSRFLTALQMRSRTTGDTVTLNKGIPQTTVQCRRCRVCLETLAHVLGQCTHKEPTSKLT
jgi:hypothetical protein